MAAPIRMNHIHVSPVLCGVLEFRSWNSQLPLVYKSPQIGDSLLPQVYFFSSKTMVAALRGVADQTTTISVYGSGR
jgi:hypothetical protein